jgi:tellurite methyltransferase
MNMEKAPKNSLSDKYNKLYSENGATFGDGKPEPFVIEASKLIPNGGSVIEFGAGQGRNSLALAGIGFQVKAIEISQVGVDGMNRIASELSLLNFEAKVNDARAELEGEYDLVVSTFMLHHLSREDAESFITTIKEHTKSGGINAISTFTEEGDFSTSGNAEGRFFPKLGEMRNLYADWEILKYTEENSKARATHPDGSPLFNIKVEIIARKGNAPVVSE